MQLRQVLISLSQAIEPVGEFTTESVTHGQCDARPTVTFPANGRYQFILLGEQRHIVCEQLAQNCYVKWSGRHSKPATSRLQVRHPNHSIIYGVENCFSGIFYEHNMAVNDRHEFADF